MSIIGEVSKLVTKLNFVEGIELHPITGSNKRVERPICIAWAKSSILAKNGGKNLQFLHQKNKQNDQKKIKKQIITNFGPRKINLEKLPTHHILYCVILFPFLAHNAVCVFNTFEIVRLINISVYTW